MDVFMEKAAALVAVERPGRNGDCHRVLSSSSADVLSGSVRWAPIKSIWFLGMATGALIGGALTFSWPAVSVFLVVTAVVLLLGHSLGNHRKLVHGSFQCPTWLEYVLVYLGAQVGLAGPIGLLRQHDLRDYAQRLPDCHPYLRHGRSPAVDAWWQLNCELVLSRPPVVRIEQRIAQNRFFVFLERTWMAQQLPGALLLYAAGGWGFIWWGLCARVTAAVFGHWLIGYLAHNHGEIAREVRGAAVQGHNVHLPRFLPWASAGTTITMPFLGRQGSVCTATNGTQAGGFSRDCAAWA